MGEVHRATDMRKNRMVALKRLPAELATDEVFPRRFRRESEFAARLAVSPDGAELYVTHTDLVVVLPLT